MLLIITDQYRASPFNMEKLMTGTIAESIYNFLDVNDKLPAEQKGCRTESRATKDQSLIDKTILRDCRKRKIREWLGLIIRWHIAWFPIPGYWKALSLCKCLISSNVNLKRVNLMRIKFCES